MITLIAPLRKIPSWALVVGLLLAGGILYWPAIDCPFFLDDYLQSAMVHGHFPAPRGPFELYDFIDSDDRAALLSQGFLPWWTDPGIALRFFRPLSSALLYLEHRTIDAHPLLMHLVSFGIWALAVLVAHGFFRALPISRRAGMFATFIFAFAPCHAIPLAWLANHEALLALLGGTFGLTASVAWLEKGAAWRAALAGLGFSLALLSGEYALCFGGYVIAFALLSRAPLARRVVLGILFVLPAAAYLFARRALGYGAFHSGFYQDPAQDLRLFADHVPWRATHLVLLGWFSSDPNFWAWAGEKRLPATLAAVAFVAGGAVALRWVLARIDEEARRATLIVLLGSSLSMVPVLAVMPSVRLLGVPLLGIAVTIGVLLDRAWFGEPVEARHGTAEWTALVATLLGFLHLVHGPVSAWLTGRQIRAYASGFRDHIVTLNERLKDVRDPEIVVVRGLDDIFFAGFAMEALGGPNARWVVLSHAGHVLLLRKDATTLDLVAGTESALYPADDGDLYRSEKLPLLPGMALDSPSVAADILDVGPHGPRRVRFDLRKDLDDPSLVWVGESHVRGFYDASPPKPGFGSPFDP